MADERLRLVAEVQDQFTGPLDKLNTALRRTASAGSKTAKDMAKDFEGFHGTLGKATSTLQGMLSPLQSLGVAGLGAGLGLSGIATALRSFSSGTQQLSILSKESGLAVNQLRALSQLGDRFGVSAETMNSGVIHLSEGMRKLKMGYGELQTSLLALDKGEFAKKLFNAKDMQDALDAAMEELSKEKDSYKRRQLAEVIFGTKDFGVIAGQVAGKYREVMQEIIASQGVMTKETEKAAAEFEKNMSRMGSAAERLKLNTLGPLLKGLNTIVESGDRAGIRGNAEAMDKDLNTRLADATKRRDELAKDPTKNADAIKSLEKEIRNLTDAIRRSKEGAGPSGVSAIPMSFSGGGIGGGGGARIYTASLGGGGGFVGGGSPTMGGFGGPLPTLGGGYGGGSGYGGSNPNVTGGGSGRGYGVSAAIPLSAGASSLNQNSPVVAANPGAYKDFLDHIAHTEGTANRSGGGYNTSLSYGKLLPGGVEQNLTVKTLNEIDALQTAMLRHPGNRWNSSAIGRYQIVRTTLRGLRRKLRLSGDEQYDEAMQDRLGAELARSRGANAAGLSQEWASLRGQRLTRAVELMRQIDPRSSTMPSGRASGDEPASERFGDKMMRRFYGDEAPTMKSGGGKGSLDITLHGFPAGSRPRASMDDLFKDVNVSKKRQLEDWT